MQIKVSGMTCGHCVTAVSNAVKAVPNVAGVAVDLDGGVVMVTGNADAAAVRSAIVEEGYEVLGTASVAESGDPAKVPYGRIGC